MAPNPEERARQTIDALLKAAGWHVCDASDTNIHAARGIAIREFPLPGYGFADYLLYVDGKAAGVIEAKKERLTLSGVETQAAKLHPRTARGLTALGQIDEYAIAMKITQRCFTENAGVSVQIQGGDNRKKRREQFDDHFSYDHNQIDFMNGNNVRSVTTNATAKEHFVIETETVLCNTRAAVLKQFQ